MYVHKIRCLSFSNFCSNYRNLQTNTNNNRCKIQYNLEKKNLLQVSEIMKLKLFFFHFTINSQ